ncbi:MAG: hypothetical protein HRU80_09605 [Ignavibacteriales bacterium]|nr:MAG: hypothetical protein HRU80_09605 [Ignavibacteriales bacterium]
MTALASVRNTIRKSEPFALRFLGLILLGTAFLKLYSPDEFTSVLISLTNAIQTGVTYISEISFLVITSESIIGLLLIFKPTEFISVISALSLFVLFLAANAILITNNYTGKILPSKTITK